MSGKRAPIGELTPQVDILGPKSRHWGRGLPPPYGGPPGRTWPMARAEALLYEDPTQSSETGTVQGLLRWQHLPMETKGVEGGKDRPGREREGTTG